MMQNIRLIGGLYIRSVDARAGYFGIHMPFQVCFFFFP